MKYFASAATEGKSWSAKGAPGAECSSRHDPLAPLGPTIFDPNRSPMTRFRIESRRTLGALLEAGMTYSRADGANVLAVGEATLRAGV